MILFFAETTLQRNAEYFAAAVPPAAARRLPVGKLRHFAAFATKHTLARQRITTLRTAQAFIPRELRDRASTVSVSRCAAFTCPVSLSLASPQPADYRQSEIPHLDHCYYCRLAVDSVCLLVLWTSPRYRGFRAVKIPKTLPYHSQTSTSTDTPPHHDTRKPTSSV